MVEKVFGTGAVATQAQADALRTAIDKLLAPGRGGTLDFSDPANGALIAGL